MGLFGLGRRRRVAINAEWSDLFGGQGMGAGIPLGTARWMDPKTANRKFAYPDSLASGQFWIGQNFDDEHSPIGYQDDRHITLVSGSRGGKGAGVIIPNLCFWPGSAIVVDPKGENATVTARRRSDQYSDSLGQRVCILDPFGEVQLPDVFKARYNPLDAIDPNSDLAIDDAARIAAALVVIESRTEPYWEEAARNLIKGIILHLLSASYLRDYRNLMGLRRLLTVGDWLTMERVKAEADPEDKLPSPFRVLWIRMRQNKAFNGVVEGTGEQMLSMADRQLSGVLESARTNTAFLDSLPMQRVLATSDFDLRELKTNPHGLTIYLTLPQRFMETHYRWLRLMIVLAVGEMERIKGRPACGHPTLFLLDEFAGLKRMEVIENAAAQAAGFGVKFLFVIQNLTQLSDVYEKSWETFLGNSGLKLFFQIEDDFTRSYLSRQLGEIETLRETRSGSSSSSSSGSDNWGTSSGTNFSRGGSTTGLWPLFGSFSSQRSRGQSRTQSRSSSQGWSNSTTNGWGQATHKRPLLNPDEIGRLLARNDDRYRPGYPGLVLAMIPGEHPLLARRINYYESRYFVGYFDPHPNYPMSNIHDLAYIPQRRYRWFRFQLRDFISRPVVLAGILLTVTIGPTIWFLYPEKKHFQFHHVETAPTSAPVSAVTSNPQAPAEPYEQGVADWDSLHAWITGQTGDSRAGADYWTANRNVPGHLSCKDAGNKYAQSRGPSFNPFVAMVFIGGCDEAARMLAPIDQRRTDPQYRSGFNDEAKRLPL